MLINHWIRHELAGRLLSLLGPILFLCASMWRRLLVRTRFIAITGSHGKTTAKELAAACLADRHPTFKSVRNQNSSRLLAVNMLRVRPWHRYAVFETATGRPGALRSAGQLVKPEIAAITSVGTAHMKSFGDIQAIAREKRSLLSSLPPHGVGIINGDDPLLAPPWDTSGRLFRFGTSPDFELSARNVSARWPGRLSFDVEQNGKQLKVMTQLVGEHWLYSVLAGLSVATRCGVPLESAVCRVAGVRSFDARLEPVRLPCGAVVIRDEYCGTPESFESALKVLGEAEAGRKILVAGDYSDSKVKPRRRLRRLGREAVGIADFAVFVGPFSHHSREAALDAGMPADNCRYFTEPQAASEHLRSLLREGDLVLIKARVNQHLSRLVFDQVAPVKCWRAACPETFLCDICWRLGLSSRQKVRVQRI